MGTGLAGILPGWVVSLVLIQSRGLPLGEYISDHDCLFLSFWLFWVFFAAHGLSLIAESRDYSLLQCMGFSLQWLLLLQSTGSRHTGFSSCSMQAQ